MDRSCFGARLKEKVTAPVTSLRNLFGDFWLAELDVCVSRPRDSPKKVERTAPASEGSTTVPSLPCSSSVGSIESCSVSVGSWYGRSPFASSGCSGGRCFLINWDQLWLGRRIQQVQRYAMCADCIQLLSRFLELARVQDIDSESTVLLLRVLRHLHKCDYSFQDICSILAHASAYYPDVLAACGGHMDPAEQGNILATLTFIAHSWVQDENCKLSVWHHCLFEKYCELDTLNEAVLRLLEIRKYVLRLKDSDLERRITFLLASANGDWPAIQPRSRKAK